MMTQEEHFTKEERRGVIKKPEKEREKKLGDTYEAEKIIVDGK